MAYASSKALDEECLLMAAVDAVDIISVRPKITFDLMTRTGLEDDMLMRLVHDFYGRVRCDPLLGPIFADRINDWNSHLETMVSFWSSVALMTGRYHGAPIPKHLHLPVQAEHFERWLALFGAAAHDICPPAGAAWLIERAERIAASIHISIKESRSLHGSADRSSTL